LSKLVLSGDTSGSVTLDAPAVSGTTILTLPTTTDTLVGKTTTDTLTNKTLTSPVIAGTPTGVGILTSSTSQATTSGTSKDFTGIPSWVKRITVMFNGVSTSGSSVKQIQIGDAGGIEITGYVGAGFSSSATYTSMSSGFLTTGAGAASDVCNLLCTLVLMDSSTNLWVYSSIGGYSVAATSYAQGNKSLSATLDRIRITTVNGTDTFDAGSVNILYE
jgi:hypothetical protein